MGNVAIAVRVYLVAKLVEDAPIHVLEHSLESKIDGFSAGGV
jgi:hypothetical protein